MILELLLFSTLIKSCPFCTALLINKRSDKAALRVKAGRQFERPLDKQRITPLTSLMAVKYGLPDYCIYSATKTTPDWSNNTAKRRLHVYISIHIAYSSSDLIYIQRKSPKSFIILFCCIYYRMQVITIYFLNSLLQSFGARKLKKEFYGSKSDYPFPYFAAIFHPRNTFFNGKFEHCITWFNVGRITKDDRCLIKTIKTENNKYRQYDVIVSSQSIAVNK